MLEEALNELQKTLERFRSQLSSVDSAGQQIIEVLRSGGKVLSCGNGGSAADALHLAEEFVGRYRGERKSLPAICLAADVTALTCIGNDYGFDDIFSRQVEGLGKSGDILVAFTTSGNSQNIIKALEAARAAGLVTILLAGKDGGLAKGLANVELVIPSDDSARIQEVHTFILHQWLEMVEMESW
ncbi:D-sedoheptulose 7-phosphate isomerase [Rubellicoccus peritrichatus]|uniref:Phosphoheptose isomerase n=1 Tax=Rubellicoccus peritrichatus TaxID=3080537 RepID=A0AAQ3LE16_9BACT|nr:D-sedoheptulose 7-phosphate isomerase [Puniceicoccus sp. CR14]WOO42907.1 D-sedoheptulose 7-phosphate isomerase [Puniceicoccus sp. CR14]